MQLHQKEPWPLYGKLPGKLPGELPEVQIDQKDDPHSMDISENVERFI